MGRGIYLYFCLNLSNLSWLPKSWERMNAILSRTQYSQRGMKKNNKKELVSKLSTVTSHEAVSYLLYHITSNHNDFGGVLTYPAFSPGLDYCHDFILMKQRQQSCTLD